LTSQTTTVEVFAPALVTLAAGASGACLCASADVGDRVSAQHAVISSLQLLGDLSDGVDVARLTPLLDELSQAYPRSEGVSLTVKKALPLDQGLGDLAPLSAAALRAVARLCGESRPDAVTSLGPAVLASLTGRAAFVTAAPKAVGATPMPALYAVLAHLETDTPRSAAMDGDLAPPPLDWGTVEDVAEWLRALPAPGQISEPIAELIDDLSLSPGCLVARHAGGGTAYALYADRPTAEGAAIHLGNLHPLTWIAATTLS